MEEKIQNMEKAQRKTYRTLMLTILLAGIFVLGFGCGRLSRRQEIFDLEELITAGNEGLETAARNFQPDSDFKFIAYAVWYIRQSMEEILKPQE